MLFRIATILLLLFIIWFLYNIGIRVDDIYNMLKK